MLATFFNSPLKRRFMAAVLALAGCVLAALGLLLFLLAAGRLPVAVFAVLTLTTVAAGTAVALWLVNKVVDRFSAPLRAVTASLHNAANGELDATAFGATIDAFNNGSALCKYLA